MNRRDEDIVRSQEERSALSYKSAVRGMWVAGIFCVLVLGLLAGNRSATWHANPQNSVPLKKMQQRLAKAPTDQRLKNDIRKLDAQLRHEYLYRLTFANQGSYVLLLGASLFLIAGATAVHYKRKMPVPIPQEVSSDALRHSAGIARRSVGVLGTILALSMMGLAVFSQGNMTAEYKKAVKGYQRPSANTKEVNVVQQAAVSASAAAPGPAAPSASGAQNQAPGAPITICPLPLPQFQVTKNTALAKEKTAAEPKPKSGIETFPLDESDYKPTAEEWASNWPVFRGPAGMGVIESGDYPMKWDGKTGSGIVWKTAIPLPGWNSPVVWGDKIFLSGANEKTREIYCFDATSGKLVWKQPFAMMAKQADIMEDTGYAPSTLVVDGRRVFAMFPNGDLGCFDFDGKQLWTKKLGLPDNQYGHGSSLAMYGNLLMVLFDQGSGDDGKSVLYALQGGTGNVVWYAKRNVPNSWATPVIATIGDRLEMLTNSNPWVISYDPMTGKEYWRAEVMSGDVAPSPVVAAGMAIACNTGAYLAAIKPGLGNLTNSGILWKADSGLPDISSPVANNGLVIMADSMGTVTCVDIKTGKTLWEHEYDNAFHASPTIVGSNVYLLDNEGIMHVIAADKKFKEVGKALLNEKASATPAFVGGRIYIRGEKNLYCIGK